MKIHLGFVFAIGLALAPLPGQAPVPMAKGATLQLPVLPAVRLTVLVDNLAGGGAVLGEWGAAILLESGRHRILFDTGGGLTLKGNAQALGINLRPLDAIVLSHGHSDHLGGLPFAVAEGKPRALFAHPLALETRYWREAGSLVPEPPPLTRSQLGQQGVRVVPTPEATEVCPGLWVTGAIPRRTSFEETGVKGHAFLDTVAAFRRLGVHRILLSHCTGHAAQAVFRTAFPGRCDWPASGTRLAFGKPAD